jgi:tRNA A-37 threonylcarbamoyl transferase component Bud32
VNARSDWERIEAALDELLALPENQWPEACSRIAAGDAALEAEIKSLLAHTGGVDPVLDQPVRMPEPAATVVVGLEPGTRVGAYRVIELIGRGGMGEVYRAERADGQYVQEVALKLIRSELADQPERFQSERQILAQLQHPGIARLLDGGMFNGLPFMAIELVKGSTLTEWCRHAGSDLTARLRLFVAVCDAVAHAHSRLVIHRDIKPGNVLVTDAGEIKLLDFGVAKLLTGAAGDVTRAAPMTPAYSAPEQLLGGAITTATDVYALGVLLFELLCGELPWRSSGLSFGVAVQKMLADSAPLPSRCARDKGDPPVPWSQLRGDLDAIVSKALRKEPQHRYTTVAALRDDVVRALRHEPVAAREGARLYVIGRFMRRQRWLVAGVAALLVVIIAGSAGILWQAREALQQARRAEQEGRKATAVKDFLLDIFRQSSLQNPGGVEAKKITAEQLLDVGANRITSQLRTQPEVREELMDTLADLNNELGLTDRAQALAADNLAELRARTDARPSEALARLETRLAAVLIDRDQEESIRAAKDHLNKALVDLQTVGAGGSLAAADAYYQLGRASYDGDTQAKAAGKRALLRALEILTRRDPANPLRGDVFDQLARYAKLEKNAPDAEHWLNEQLVFQTAQGEERNQFAIGDAYFSLADHQTQQMHFEAAEANFHRAIDLLTRSAGADHPETAEARARLAEMYYYSGRAAEAEPLLRDALQSDMRTPQGASNATEHRRTLGFVELARGRLSEAEQLLRQDLAELQGGLKNELRWGITAHGLVAVLIAEGELVEARELYVKSMDVYQRYFGEKSRDYRSGLIAGGSLALAEHKPREAADIFEQALKESPAAPGTLSYAYTNSALGLAAAYLDLDRPQEALQYAGEVLQHVSAIPAPYQSQELKAQSLRLMGEAVRRSGRAGEAEAPLRQAVKLREALDDDAVSPWLAQARIDLAECLITLRQRDEAQELIKQAAAALSRQPRLRDRYLQDLRHARALLANGP